MATSLSSLTSSTDRKVKTFDPRTTTVGTLMGTGKKGTNDETGETCTFAQLHGICCLQNTAYLCVGPSCWNS